MSRDRQLDQEQSLQEAVGEDRDVWEAVVLGAILEEQEAWHAANGLGGGEPREGALLPERCRLQLASLSAR